MIQKINEVEDPTVDHYEPKPEGEKQFWKQHIIQKHTKLSEPIKANAATFNAANIKKDKTRSADKNPNDRGVVSENKAVSLMKEKVALFKTKYGSAWKEAMYAESSVFAEDSQAASSDNPGSGTGTGGPADGGNIDKSHRDMGNVSPEKKPQSESRDVLEKIAMQAAEMHDSIDDKELSDELISKLTDVKDALEEVYEAFTSDSGDKGDDGQDDSQGGSAVKEEAEPLDELSKKTLGSYINKASKSGQFSANMSGYSDAENYHTGKLSGAKQQFQRDADKRSKGINKAVSKLTKEEADQLDELSAAFHAAAANHAAKNKTNLYGKTVPKLGAKPAKLKTYSVKTEESNIEEGAFSSKALKPSQQALDDIKKVPSTSTIIGKDGKGKYTSKMVNGKEVSKTYAKEDVEPVEEAKSTMKTVSSMKSKSNTKVPAPLAKAYADSKHIDKRHKNIVTAATEAYEPIEEAIPMGHKGIKPTTKDKGKSIAFSKVTSADSFKNALAKARAKSSSGGAPNTMRGDQN